MAEKKCPETGGECLQRYSCEHSKRGTAIVCMKVNVRRWINEEPPFGTNKPERKTRARSSTASATK